MKKEKQIIPRLIELQALAKEIGVTVTEIKVMNFWLDLDETISDDYKLIGIKIK